MPRACDRRESKNRIEWKRKLLVAVGTGQSLTLIYGKNI